MIAIAAGFLVGLILALLLCPLAIRVAWATGYLDHPEARKLHTSATALLGGAVVFISGVAGWLVAIRIGDLGTTTEISGIAAGAVLCLAVGMWDDRFGMNPLIKLMAHASAGVLLMAGQPVPHLGLPWHLDSWLTLVAIVGMLNAVNFLDNMNGMVSGLAAIALAGFAYDSLWRGDPGLATGQLALAGACLGFLRYNFPRARMFLGDAGSLFLGYSLCASGLLAFNGASHGWARLGPLLILAYPVFDIVFVVIKRLREGRKVYQGGTDHTNHRLASVLRCQRRTVMLIWAVGAALCVSGLVVERLNQPLPALLLLGLWITIFLLAGLRLSSVPATATPAPIERLATGGTPNAKT
jgi:UDP-GlcNAc:undecaprenyl-phosphate GlcNAc-1-phosphate transferase